MQKTPALSPARAVSEIDLTVLLNMLHCAIWSVSPKVCRADAR